MAVPCDFEESNTVLDKPPEMGVEECTPLNVCRAIVPEVGMPIVISCWKLTQEELDEIIKTKRVWLIVIGNTMPPVGVVGIKPDIQINDK